MGQLLKNNTRAHVVKLFRSPTLETVNMVEGTVEKVLFLPMKEIILKDNPKTPRIEREPQPREDWVLLEDLVPEFQKFVVETGTHALDDAKANIQLKVNQL